MKKIYILCGFLFIFNSIKAQETEEPKFRTFFDFGYYHSSYRLASNGGTYISAGFGYKINKEFWLNLNLIKISSSGADEPNSSFYNNQVAYNNTLVVPNFSKDWSITNKFSIGGALGVAIIFENVWVPFANFNNGRITSIESSNRGEPFDLGLYGELFLKYELRKNFNFVINTKSYIPLYLEPDSFMVGAGLEIKF